LKGVVSPGATNVDGKDSRGRGDRKLHGTARCRAARYVGVGEHVIEVRSLVKRYPDITAVDGIDFDVNRGEVFSLLGPNGAGKTTTVEILEGLRDPTAGEARVLGEDVRSGYRRIRDRVGVLPQDFEPF